MEFESNSMMKRRNGIILMESLPWISNHHSNPQHQQCQQQCQQHQAEQEEQDSEINKFTEALRKFRRNHGIHYSQCSKLIGIKNSERIQLIQRRRGAVQVGIKDLFATTGAESLLAFGIDHQSQDSQDAHDHQETASPISTPITVLSPQFIDEEESQSPSISTEQSQMKIGKKSRNKGTQW